MKQFVKTELKDIINLPVHKDDYTVVIENFLFFDPLKYEISKKTDSIPALDLLPHLGLIECYFEVLILSPRMTDIDFGWNDFCESLFDEFFELKKKANVKGFVFKFSSTFLLCSSFIHSVGNYFPKLNMELIIQPSMIMFHQPDCLRCLITFCKYWVLPGVGYFETTLQPLECGPITFLKPINHTNLEPIKQFWEECKSDYFHDKVLLQLGTTGLKYKIYNDDHVLGVDSVYRNDCFRHEQLLNVNEPEREYEGCIIAPTDPRTKKKEETYWETSDQVRAKIDYFINENIIVGFIIDNIGFDCPPEHPDSIFQIVQKKLKQVPVVSNKQSLPTQPTSVTNDDDEKHKPEEKDNTIPEENEEIFVLE